MPELPDVVLSLDALRPRVVGRTLERIRIASPFVLRSVDPPVGAVEGQPVRDLRRIGKRIVFVLDGDLFVVIHLMIAGRLRWRERGMAIPRKLGLAAFSFDNGSLLFTEAGTKKRASLHIVGGEDALREHDRGGLEVLDSSVAAFSNSLTRENHTLKRALTDPRLFSGIGNAYSDEILHRARLSPMQLTRNLTKAQIAQLHAATIATLRDWIVRLHQEPGDAFPEKVTAFRPGMAVHGRFGQPCPECGAPVQRIVYGENEANYCARCQTGGRLLADRALSRLLRDDWPKKLEEW